ncbi:MAG: hypothetical protein E7163_03745 [Firmicutes bacterium]|nr:hypothetical protein [Bacillota bacterium]
MKKKEKSFLEKISFEFNKIILADIVLNILFLVFGFIIYMNPYVTANIVGIIIGLYFIFFGIFAIYEFLMRKDLPIFKFKIFMGVLLLILGLFVMLNPLKIIKILTLTIGMYLIVISTVKLLETFKLKKISYDGWIIMLVTSILLFIFGLLMLINPMASMDIIQLTGIFIVLSCILEIANLFMIYTKAKDIKKLFKEIK